MTQRPDILILMTDQERAAPPYESAALGRWRSENLTCERWFDDHAVRFDRHYTGSLACVPSRPTLFTGHYPDVHGVTQTDGLAKKPDDTRMRWLPPGEVPTLGNWFRAAGYDTHYDGKWHISHADLHDGDGKPLATCDSRGNLDEQAVQAYLDADPLNAYGFSGWVGPEPHGAPTANSGLRRDPLVADRVVRWLQDRYERRAGGDQTALRPFLLVASFVNPHDVCLFAKWAVRSPVPDRGSQLPPIDPSPTAGEDLRDKPAAQSAYRDAFFTGFAGAGAAAAAVKLYDTGGDAYRRLYYRLHLEVDQHLERVRRTVADGSANAVLVRTSDHGELLGAHGGLHQKWFTLYDEATRVPFAIARTDRAPEPRRVDTPTSHVDLVPTLLAAAGIDEAETAASLSDTFTEVHPLPGRNLLPVVDGAEPERDRPVYLQTRDNSFESDALASAGAQIVGLPGETPPILRVAVPVDVGANLEGIVVRVSDDVVAGGADHLWKLVRTFDDPSTWTSPGDRQLAATGPAGIRWRQVPLDDEWELYDLTDDPNESANRWTDDAVAAVRDHLLLVLDQQRASCLPRRNQPWPYVPRRPPTSRIPWPADIIAKVRNTIRS